MLSKILIKTDKPITLNRKEAIIDVLRASIVNASKNSGLFSEDEKRLIDFRPPPPYYQLPVILYGQPRPNGKEFEIFGYGAIGKEIISKMGKALLKQKKICLKLPKLQATREIKIKSFELSKNNLPFLPALAESPIDYYTATPVILYDKEKDFNEWFAITENYKKSNPEQYKQEMQRSITNLIKANIETQLKQRIKDKPYPFIKDIDINIKDFIFTFHKYHKEQKPTPFLRMKFTSSWKIPMFIGHHTGKGYGMILIDKKVKKDN